MANLLVLKPIDQKEKEERKQRLETMRELVKKYFTGGARVEISEYFPEEYDVFKDNDLIARINMEHKTLGIRTNSLPNWLIEAIIEIEETDSVAFTVYANNE